MEINSIYRELQQIKYNLFKEQNVETGFFDVTFEFDGKLLYAHKTMLNLVSSTFASMFSDRSTKDEPIKIKEYSYDDFFQFLTFLYSEPCQLTDSNIYTMVDIAEFYGVQLFKKYCDQFLNAMTITTENIFKLMDLADKYSLPQLKFSLHAFITSNFQSFMDSDGFLKADKTLIEKLIVDLKDKIKPEELFQAVYKWSENQTKGRNATDPTIVLNDAIKTEITDFLPKINFDKMELKFLHEFVVPRGFVFSSLEDLSKILSSRYSQMPSQMKVTITNSSGQTLHGKITLDRTLLKNIDSISSSTELRYTILNQIRWSPVFQKPSTPSSLKKRNGVEWYLVYFPDGYIGVTHSKHILKSSNYYLIAEMTVGTSGFQITMNCNIEIE